MRFDEDLERPLGRDAYRDAEYVPYLPRAIPKSLPPRKIQPMKTARSALELTITGVFAITLAGLLLFPLWLISADTGIPIW